MDGLTSSLVLYKTSADSTLEGRESDTLLCLVFLTMGFLRVTTDRFSLNFWLRGLSLSDATCEAQDIVRSFDNSFFDPSTMFLDVCEI